MYGVPRASSAVCTTVAAHLGWYGRQPQMYGVPRASSAVCTTVAALPEIVAGGSGGGRSGGAPFPLAPLPPALLPSPNDTPSVALTPSRASGRGFQNPLGPRSSSR